MIERVKPLIIENIVHAEKVFCKQKGGWKKFLMMSWGMGTRLREEVQPEGKNKGKGR
jgi:hypothetical protein